MKTDILLIEDDDSIRDVLKLILETEGFQVTPAPNGKIGLDLLSDGLIPRLVLVDLMMPIVNGWDFVTEFRKNPAFVPTPVLVLSAYSDKGEPLDVQGVVAKPVDLTFFLNQVQQCLESCSQYERN
jgi:CheY-like chemotaxis protein